MFGLSAWHLAILVVVGLFVFGPERLPTMLRDLGKALRQVRQAANAMQEDLKAELGPEVGDLDLASLNPKTFVRKHLFEDDDDLTAPPRSAYRPLPPSEPAPWDPDTT
jgi:sec-independent protein translocase protein TatB